MIKMKKNNQGGNKMKTLFFVYGTLVYPDVRERILGHTVFTKYDILTGFRKEGLNIKQSNNDEVKGITFEATEEDVRKLDFYEGSYYKKIQVKLESGRVANVYCYKTEEIKNIEVVQYE